MLSKGIMIPLSFANLPVISITFFDKKTRHRKRKEEEEIDVPPDGLSLEDLENLDLDQLETQSSRLSDKELLSDNGTKVITILSGWSFIPSITISFPRNVKPHEPSFDTAEDDEIIEGIRKAPIPDTIFESVSEYDRPLRDRDVAEFDPVTDAIIRPDVDIENILKPRTASSPESKLGMAPTSLPATDLQDQSDMDLDLDLEAEPNDIGFELGVAEEHTIKPESSVAGRSTLVPVAIERDDLDMMLGGGLPRSSIVLIEGRKGCGVEQFVQRLTFGFLQNGVGVTYISTENVTSDFIEQMYGSGYLMANHLLGKKILYIPIDSLIRKDRATAGYIDRLIRSPQLLNDVIIIDRLSTMTANDLDENGHLKLLSYLKGAVTKNRTVILVTDEKQNGIEVIREEAMARMSLAVIEDGPETTHSVHVLKYPESVIKAKQEIRFKIEPGLGMVVQ
jgi:archaeal flagellar protein FlaH